MTNLPSSNLKDWPFYWITQVTAKYERMLERELKKLGLDIPSWRVLLLLQDNKPKNITFLGEQSITKQSTMTRIIRRMREKGLVEIQSSKHDARVSEVTATEKGNALRQEVWKAVNAKSNAALEKITDTDRIKLIQTLSSLYTEID